MFQRLPWVGLRLELAHAKQVRTIAAAVAKTDQIDESVLAHLARLIFLPTHNFLPG